MESASQKEESGAQQQTPTEGRVVTHKTEADPAATTRHRTHDVLVTLSPRRPSSSSREGSTDVRAVTEHAAGDAMLPYLSPDAAKRRGLTTGRVCSSSDTAADNDGDVTPCPLMGRVSKETNLAVESDPSSSPMPTDKVTTSGGLLPSLKGTVSATAGGDCEGSSQFQESHVPESQSAHGVGHSRLLNSRTPVSVKQEDLPRRRHHSAEVSLTNTSAFELATMLGLRRPVDSADYQHGALDPSAGVRSSSVCLQGQYAGSPASSLITPSPAWQASSAAVETSLSPSPRIESVWKLDSLFSSPFSSDACRSSPRQQTRSVSETVYRTSSDEFKSSQRFKLSSLPCGRGSNFQPGLETGTDSASPEFYRGQYLDLQSQMSKGSVHTKKTEVTIEIESLGSDNSTSSVDPFQSYEKVASDVSGVELVFTPNVSDGESSKTTDQDDVCDKGDMFIINNEHCIFSSFEEAARHLLSSSSNSEGGRRDLEEKDLIEFSEDNNSIKPQKERRHCLSGTSDLQTHPANAKSWENVYSNSSTTSCGNESGAGSLSSLPEHGGTTSASTDAGTVVLPSDVGCAGLPYRHRAVQTEQDWTRPVHGPGIEAAEVQSQVESEFASLQQIDSNISSVDVSKTSEKISDDLETRTTTATDVGCRLTRFSYKEQTNDPDSSSRAADNEVALINARKEAQERISQSKETSLEGAKDQKEHGDSGPVVRIYHSDKVTDESVNESKDNDAGDTYEDNDNDGDADGEDEEEKGEEGESSKEVKAEDIDDDRSREGPRFSTPKKMPAVDSADRMLVRAVSSLKLPFPGPHESSEIDSGNIYNHGDKSRGGSESCAGDISPVESASPFHRALTPENNAEGTNLQARLSKDSVSVDTESSANSTEVSPSCSTDKPTPSRVESRAIDQHEPAVQRSRAVDDSPPGRRRSRQAKDDGRRRGDRQSRGRPAPPVSAPSSSFCDGMDLPPLPVDETPEELNESLSSSRPVIADLRASAAWRHCCRRTGQGLRLLAARVGACLASLCRPRSRHGGQRPEPPDAGLL